MEPIFRIKRNDIGPDIRRYASEMHKGLRQVVREAARGITRYMIENTPPNSAQGRGRDGLKSGVDKISRQMQAVLAPVRLKGRRKITTVFGHRLRRPVYVATREKYPDVAALYRANTHARGTGIGIRVSGTGQKFHVDKRKFDAELKLRSASVGKLAAGFSEAAKALDLPLQNWIGRHTPSTSFGRVAIDTAGERMRITVENFAPGVPANVQADVARRIPFAIEYQRGAMRRGIEGMHNRLRRKGERLAA